MLPQTTGRLFVDSKKTAIPYEVFLNIVEALISVIESDQTAHTFQIVSCYYGPTHLAVTPCWDSFMSSSRITSLDANDIKPMQSRYRETSLPAQINRWSRAKTFKTFRRLHMSLTHRGPDPLVLPEIDRFDPAYALISWPAHNLLEQPSPSDYALLQHVVHIVLRKPLDLLRFDHKGSAKSISAFPALKRITVGSDFISIHMAPIHPGISPIDKSPFEQLAFELALMSEKFPHILQQFKKRDIKLFGALRSTGDVIVEVILLETLHLQYMYPDCTCCEWEE
ncbi:hypothetical protein CkaCkLH20_08932 [Colletotrichum karsti]|uniref:Uncharacterized protein n=1 Tax=Colletotrichum karsti TaxID=1095194 RepID=A0A9P6HXT2_9PEZI|nr:uncharacterized protein CkaCkLH20_08932 [Colletotrichum karsti]KAF9873473.1 hypothetical protein CkaCkLH20_08932 [Colletotrichum karsti]